MRSRCLTLTFATVALALGAGCRDSKISAYRVPREEPAPPRAAPTSVPATAAGAGQAGVASTNAGGTPDMASTPVTTAQGSGLAWTGPAGWVEKPATAMRRGTFIINGEGGATAELTITAFPGNVGGDLANVNRWRGQLQLAPTTQAELERDFAHADYNGLHFDVIDIPGMPAADAQRILGAIVPFDGATWFFKLMGPDALVQREKPAFLEFLKTVKPR